MSGDCNICGSYEHVESFHDKQKTQTDEIGQVDTLVILLRLYENYFKAAEDFINYLTKNRKRIPDKYFVPYEAEQVSLVWELTEREGKQ